MFLRLGIGLRSTVFEVQMVAHGCVIPMVVGVCDGKGLVGLL